jgi:CMP-N,N'-diacetyllegionaminic acid synthase
MNVKPKILGIIPARSGSKGIPGKNRKLLGKMPLVGYTIQSALASQLLDTIMVSSDDPEILRFASQFSGIQTPFVRPKHLADDEATSFEVVEHALKHYFNEGIPFDYVCLLQPTCPFRLTGLIDDCIQYIIDLQADSLISVRQTPHKFSPYWAFQKNPLGQLSLSMETYHIITRRQDLPVTYYRDGSIYITKTSLINAGMLLGGKIVGFENDGSPDINIDTHADWEAAEKLLANGQYS